MSPAPASSLDADEPVSERLHHHEPRDDHDSAEADDGGPIRIPRRELTLERLGVSAAEALLVDDIEINCDAARQLGMQAVWFRSTDQAVAEIERALADGA